MMTCQNALLGNTKTKRRLFATAMLFAFSASPVSAQTFTVESVPNAYTAIYSDPQGRQITVTGEPQDTDCFAFDAVGIATLFARSSLPACDRAIIMTFETSGFLFDSVLYPDIDDIDGSAPRDSFSASVPGTWTSPTIEVYSFANPPAFADQAARLSSQGGTGTFLANAAGNDPTNETATFALTTPQTDFSIIYDDVEGARNARAQFNLNFLIVQVTAGTILSVADGASGINGVTGQNSVLNAFTGDTLNGVAAGPTNSVLSVASGSAVPPQLSFDISTGIVGVNAGTPAGLYSFNYTTCEIGFPTNCSTTSVNVEVAPTTDLAITKTNTPGQNGDADLASDVVISGNATSYTLTVTNNGPDSVTGAIVTDVPGGGITCPDVNPVSISGDGTPVGSFTVADLTGPGITLGTLANGEAAVFQFSCQVD